MTKKISKPNTIQQELINSSVKYEKILKKIILHFQEQISANMKITNKYDLAANAWNMAFLKQHYPEVPPGNIIRENSFLKSQRKLLDKMIKYILKKWPEKMLFIRSLEVVDDEPKVQIHVNIIEDDHFLDNILKGHFDGNLDEDFENEFRKESDEDTFDWDFKEGFVNRTAIKVIPQKPFYKWARMDPETNIGKNNFNPHCAKRH